MSNMFLNFDVAVAMAAAAAPFELLLIPVIGSTLAVHYLSWERYQKMND